MHNFKNIIGQWLFTYMCALGFILRDSDTNLQPLMKQLDKIEDSLKAQDEKAAAEKKINGESNEETKKAIKKLGDEQKAIADQLLEIQQKGSAPAEGDVLEPSEGKQFVDSAEYKSYVGGSGKKIKVEVKNTVGTVDAHSQSERRPGIIEGAFRELTLESYLTSLPTTSSSIDYLREDVFVNNAAETAEKAEKPESSFTMSEQVANVATVAHWIKISEQLAQDEAAVAAYITRRMTWGVNLRVENQIINGDGVAPNIGGLLAPGNFTDHGYTTAQFTTLGLTPTNQFDLLGKVVGDCASSDYPANVIILNPADWWLLRLKKDDNGQYMLGQPGSLDPIPRIWGLPVVSSNAMPVGKFLVASLREAATLYNRSGIMVAMSDSDDDNFTKNLITLRVERRCGLAVEKPAAIRGGDLTLA